jgi:hypothetical protein
MRRFIAVASTPTSFAESFDFNADVAQGIEALDRALRCAAWVIRTVPALSLPAGPDWSSIRDFARRGRDAIAHGDERLAEPGPGYSVSVNRGIVRQFGKARRDRDWRTDEVALVELMEACDVLGDWFIGDASNS